ncbi:hypothetical protein BKA56DRAFT_593624 [Ilyonectria sp. MPI-CAGE-AT-0026]|nr:hypothetical protein BKA56DRAFT_593624 [Ilyonectria sp. MPI-CAGE-AT-0026]
MVLFARLQFLFAFATLAVLGSAAPPDPGNPESMIEVTTKVFGPLNTWRPIKAINIHRGSTVDGVRVNDSFVVGYEPPQLSPEKQNAKHQQLFDLVSKLPIGACTEDASAPAMANRAYRTQCGVPASRALVPLDQLYSAIRYYCYTTPASGWWNWWYRPEDNSWQPFTNKDREVWPVWLGGAVRPGYTWSAWSCYSAMMDIVNDCHEPRYSPGGVGQNHPSGFDAVLMPRWFIYADR